METSAVVTLTANFPEDGKVLAEIYNHIRPHPKSLAVSIPQMSMSLEEFAEASKILRARGYKVERFLTSKVM